MNILITGGCGYVGSKLVLDLAAKEHFLRVVDSQWFGNYLPELKNVEIIRKMYAEIDENDLNGIDVVIHLANVANDPSVELNPTMSWEINVLNHTQLLDKCKKNKSVKKFIYASSGSVYGVKEEEKVTEDLELVPISVYNKTKMVAERIALSYANDFSVYVIRPATVCGVSPRMRFDVVVNLFTLQAFKDGIIRVLGGDQIRPNIHIKDMVDVYNHFISNELTAGIYNAGFENISVNEIAHLVANITGAEIKWKESNDPRSYRQDSTKLISTGFIPSKNVHDAISEIIVGLREKTLLDLPQWHTVGWMVKNIIPTKELN